MDAPSGHGGCPSVVVVGGGFTGASVAVQLLRHGGVDRVTVVEPRVRVGPGLAYSRENPDHRLNAPAQRHWIDPRQPNEFLDWLETSGCLRDDPLAVSESGSVFARRRDFGRFLSGIVEGYQRRGELEHQRSRVVQVEADPQGGWQLSLDSGETLGAEAVFLATGNSEPEFPSSVSRALWSRSDVVRDGLDDAALLEGLGHDDHVLILGSGLSTLDTLMTLARAGHRGRISILSRRGLRPRPQPPASARPAMLQLSSPEDQRQAAVPDFLSGADARRVRVILRRLRQRIASDASLGLPWYVAFSELREHLWWLWPALPPAEQQRCIRRLGIWYQVHRFLSVPQTESQVRVLEQAGRLEWLVGRIRGMRALSGQPSGLELDWLPASGRVPATLRFDRLVNCTGVAARATGQPLLHRLQQQGLARPDPTGLGWSVDTSLRLLDRTGAPNPGLFLVGPPAVGSCGDSIGAGYIALGFGRRLPAVLEALEAVSAEPG